MKQVNGRVALGVGPGVIGDQADLETLERGKAFEHESIDAISDRVLQGGRAGQGGGRGWVNTGRESAGNVCKIEASDRLGCECAEGRFEGEDVPFAIRMHPVRE